MKILLIRHGEADYSAVDKKGYLGFGRDLAPLSQKGIEQAEKVSQISSLIKSQVIISSPYTRALQTASIISKNTRINISVELGLHERIPDLYCELRTQEEFIKSFEDYDLFEGIYPDLKKYHWESTDLQIERLKFSLQKYLNYNQIIIVSHGELIRRFKSVRLPFCGLVEVEYDENYRFLGWS